MTICLAMIVKNEAHCIDKCLESIKPFINYWVICDTGSTDNTKEVVMNILKDIPGDFYYHDWIDFSTNRNLSLQLAKSKADYTLIMDADDYLVYSQNPFSSLTEEAYKIEISHGSISYYRPQLIHNSIEYRYVGVLHEYLELPVYIQPTNLNNCKIIYGANGARSKDPNTYLKDALVLEKALEKEPNNSRYTFYCAQSFRDAKQLEKALAYYLQRDKLNGWIEEKYIACLEAAKILEKLNPDKEMLIESAYIKAYNYVPTRAESLTYLASYCRKRNLYDKSYFYSSLGLKIKKPLEGLFIESSCYDWRLLDEKAIAAFYIGRKNECKILNQQLLTSSLLPEQERNRIIKNLTFV
jgi:glycosyltransferase involved in cell wall biosynthesis